MMASSTTIPIARISANSTMVLSVKPNTASSAKVPISDTGMAMPGISVARQSPKNRNTTSTTSSTAVSRSVPSSKVMVSAMAPSLVE
jgi:hypothetical protein